jgi:hypothetical protein
MKESEKKKGGGSLASSLTFSKNRVYIDRHQNRFLEWLEGVKGYVTMMITGGYLSWPHVTKQLASQ